MKSKTKTVKLLEQYCGASATGTYNKIEYGYWG